MKDSTYDLTVVALTSYVQLCYISIIYLFIIYKQEMNIMGITLYTTKITTEQQLKLAK